jgi:NAD(P)-dependent dehydrogenase (short-subunit alcohol dehydrogenase family)
MSTDRKVAVITGASQGIGAGLVRSFLDRNYPLIANSRSIQPDPSEDILAIAGVIAEPAIRRTLDLVVVEQPPREAECLFLEGKSGGNVKQDA